MTDDPTLRDRLVSALGQVRLNLGPNALAMVGRGETILLSGNEKDAVADAALAVVQPELDQLHAEVDATVLVGWYCWRCAAINPQACRSDSVPILVPSDWADDMVKEIAKREEGDDA